MKMLRADIVKELKELGFRNYSKYKVYELQAALGLLKRSYEPDRVHKILKVNGDGFNSNGLEDLELSLNQVNQVQKGIYSTVDVSIFSNKKYDSQQMAEIRTGLEANIDVTPYLDESFSWYKMSVIRTYIERFPNFAEVIDVKKFDTDQMEQIALGLQDGVDVEAFAKPEYNYAKMQEIRDFLFNNLDYTKILNRELDLKSKRDIKEDMLNGTYSDHKYFDLNPKTNKYDLLKEEHKSPFMSNALKRLKIIRPS
ncbi:MAG: hypothetical protein R3Y64_10125 [Peptostreptococcaceae bacterium]